MPDFPWERFADYPLKPCPFCGATQDAPFEERVMLVQCGSGVRVECNICKAQGNTVDLPGRTEELAEFRDLVDDVYDLPQNIEDWGLEHVWLFNGQLAARFWNNRRTPRA